jgi:hypothetical protein
MSTHAKKQDKSEFQELMNLSKSGADLSDISNLYKYTSIHTILLPPSYE